MRNLLNRGKLDIPMGSSPGDASDASSCASLSAAYALLPDDGTTPLNTIMVCCTAAMLLLLCYAHPP